MSMGDSAPLPNPAAIARAELFTREQFVYEGETLEEALAPGSARRRALDAAVAEMEKGAVTPSIEWRRQISLLLGLERLLSEEEPHLAAGTALSAHQVDALSGTRTALLAEAQRNRSGNGAAQPAAPPPIAGAQEPEDDDPPGATLTEDEDDEDLLDEDDDEDDEEEEDEEDEDGEEGEDEDEEEPELDDRASDDEEPVDWQADSELDEDVEAGEQPEDPNADRRFWFEH